MLLSVDLDDELCRMAIEIDDIAVERNLTPELRAMKARTAQALPKHVLSARRVLAQGAGEFAAFGGHVFLARGDPLHEGMARIGLICGSTFGGWPPPEGRAGGIVSPLAWRRG